MKALVYFITAIIIASTLYLPIRKTQDNNITVNIKAETDNPSAALLEQSTKIISERLKAYGLSSFETRIDAGKGRIKFIFPGETGINEIEGLLTEKGELTFYETTTGIDQKIMLAGNPVLKGSDVEKISFIRDEAGMPKINIRFKPGAATIWADVTEKNTGKPLAIVIDDRIIYSPVVRQPIKGGLCEITGNYSEKEILFLVALLSNDPLPLPFSIIN